MAGLRQHHEKGIPHLRAAVCQGTTGPGDPGPAGQDPPTVPARDIGVRWCPQDPDTTVAEKESLGNPTVHAKLPSVTLNYNLLKYVLGLGSVLVYLL